MDVILDLISFVEAAQHVEVGSMMPRRNTLEKLTSDNALRLYSKGSQLRVCLCPTSIPLLCTSECVRAHV